MSSPKVGETNPSGGQLLEDPGPKPEDTEKPVAREKRHLKAVKDVRYPRGWKPNYFISPEDVEIDPFESSR